MVRRHAFALLLALLALATGPAAVFAGDGGCPFPHWGTGSL